MIGPAKRAFLIDCLLEPEGNISAKPIRPSTNPARKGMRNKTIMMNDTEDPVAELRSRIRRRVVVAGVVACLLVVASAVGWFYARPAACERLAQLTCKIVDEIKVVIYDPMAVSRCRELAERIKELGVPERCEAAFAIVDADADLEINPTSLPLSFDMEVLLYVLPPERSASIKAQMEASLPDAGVDQP